ncbi:hypothetical protein LCGC14_0243800 [marine sediment metagenome]|uniref:Uncharacterized protein n=1 Tax=marine sediment metagenome TaxID=412755 RepID=A0A0F9XAZ8_9ZZZZ
MRRLLSMIQDAFRPLQREDFGEFGVMVRNESGNLVPMTQAYMDDLKAEVHEMEEDFWFQKQAEAFATHGEAILKPQ